MFWIDLLILIVVAYNVWSGYSTGMLRSLINVAALIVSTYLAVIYRDDGASIIHAMFNPQPLILPPLGFIFVWMMSYLFVSLGGIALNAIIEGISPIKIGNKIAGAALGLLFGMMMVSLPLLAVKSSPVLVSRPIVRQAINGSLLMPLINPLLPLTKGIMTTFLGRNWFQAISGPVQVKHLPKSLKKQTTPVERPQNFDSQFKKIESR